MPSQYTKSGDLTPRFPPEPSSPSPSSPPEPEPESPTPGPETTPPEVVATLAVGPVADAPPAARLTNAPTTTPPEASSPSVSLANAAPTEASSPLTSTSTPTPALVRAPTQTPTQATSALSLSSSPSPHTLLFSEQWVPHLGLGRSSLALHEQHTITRQVNFQDARVQATKERSVFERQYEPRGNEAPSNSKSGDSEAGRKALRDVSHAVVGNAAPSGGDKGTNAISSSQPFHLNQIRQDRHPPFNQHPRVRQSLQGLSCGLLHAICLLLLPILQISSELIQAILRHVLPYALVGGVILASIHNHIFTIPLVDNVGRLVSGHTPRILRGDYYASSATYSDTPRQTLTPTISTAAPTTTPLMHQTSRSSNSRTPLTDSISEIVGLCSLSEVKLQRFTAVAHITAPAVRSSANIVQVSRFDEIRNLTTRYNNVVSSFEDLQDRMGEFDSGIYSVNFKAVDGFRRVLRNFRAVLTGDALEEWTYINDMSNRPTLVIDVASNICNPSTTTFLSTTCAVGLSNTIAQEPTTAALVYTCPFATAYHFICRHNAGYLHKKLTSQVLNALSDFQTFLSTLEGTLSRLEGQATDALGTSSKLKTAMQLAETARQEAERALKVKSDSYEVQRRYKHEMPWWDIWNNRKLTVEEEGDDFQLKRDISRLGEVWSIQQYADENLGSAHTFLSSGKRSVIRARQVVEQYISMLRDKVEHQSQFGPHQQIKLVESIIAEVEPRLAALDTVRDAIITESERLISWKNAVGQECRDSGELGTRYEMCVLKTVALQERIEGDVKSKG